MLQRGYSVKNIDCRKCKSLTDAAQNPDGTWNGARALSWLSEAVSPGHGISEAEVNRMFKDAAERKRSTLRADVGK